MRYRNSSWAIEFKLYGIKHQESSDELHIDFSPSLSCAQRPLCLEGRLGRQKKKARVGQWEREREEERPFPSSHRPTLLAIFLIIAIFRIGIPNGSLWGRERVPPRIHPQSLFLFPRLLSFQETKKENLGTSLQMLKEEIAKGYKPFNKLCNRFFLCIEICFFNSNHHGRYLFLNTNKYIHIIS